MFARLLVGLLVMLCAFSVVGREANVNRQFEYSCFLFDQGYAPAFGGNFKKAEFSALFLEDSQVGGERIETPKNADPIGVLVFADVEGKPFFTMPLHHWDDEGQAYYSCQSSQIGKAPKLRILEHSQERLLAELESTLEQER